MAIPRLGVEEEYLLVDPATRKIVPAASRVVEEAAELGEHVGKEITRFQVEARTPPCAGPADLLAALRHMRRTVADAAKREGLVIAASGAPVLGPPTLPPLTDEIRYQVGDQVYGALTDEQTMCALHVHVELPDRERALLVSNHLRPWLPALIAMAANSPFFLHRDTRHASWRILTWCRWPVAGPPPYFTGLADYDRLVAALLDAGVLLDPGTIFWDVRPSTRLPTVEIRVMDVPLAVEDSALLAVLVRALVGVALVAVNSGDPGPQLSVELLRAAYWQAARYGLHGPGIEVASGRLTEPAELVDGLVRYARPMLEEYGDMAMVEEGMSRLLVRGTGATSQRAEYTRRGSFADVVDHVAERTLSAELLG